MHLILITTVWGGHTLQVREGSLGTGKFSRYIQLVMAKLDFKSWKLVPEHMFSAATSSPTLSLVSSKWLLSPDHHIGTGLGV